MLVTTLETIILRTMKVRCAAVLPGDAAAQWLHMLWACAPGQTERAPPAQCPPECAPPPPPCISQSDQAQPVLAQALQLPAARQALLQHLRSDQGHQLLADVLKRLPAPGANRSSEQQGAAHVVQLITHAINRDLQALDTD